MQAASGTGGIFREAAAERQRQQEGRLMQSVCPIMLTLNISAPASCPDTNFTQLLCPPPDSAPLTAPLCKPPLFIPVSLISHARI